MPKLAKGEHIILHAPTGLACLKQPFPRMHSQSFLSPGSGKTLAYLLPILARRSSDTARVYPQLPQCSQAATDHARRCTGTGCARADASRCKPSASPCSLSTAYSEHNLLGAGSGRAITTTEFRVPCGPAIKALSADTCQAIIFVPTPELALQAAASKQDLPRSLGSQCCMCCMLLFTLGPATQNPRSLSRTLFSNMQRGRSHVS